MLRWMTAPPVRYGAAVFAVAIALAVRIAFDPWLGDRSAYMTHIVAITAIALWVGRGPAILEQNPIILAHTLWQ